jgi:hypothetical protein
VATTEQKTIQQSVPNATSTCSSEGIAETDYNMNLSEQIDEMLDKYDMERSEEAEEIGKMVAGLQD